MYSCHSILACNNLFSGVKLSIRLFRFITVVGQCRNILPLRQLSCHGLNHSQAFLITEMWQENHGCEYYMTDFL